MASKLVISKVEDLQGKIFKTLKSFDGGLGIYVSLNKTQKSLEESFVVEGINTDKIFFIDCVTLEKTKDEVLHIPPNDLEKLRFSIESFVEEIHGEKFLIIDALSTLLIYNTENDVAAFIKNVAEDANRKDLRLIAFSPETKGEELLNKIFNFFDEVRK